MRAESIAVLLLLASPVLARPRAVRERPSADALLLRALAGPATGYTGVVRVQMFRPGAKPKGVTVSVSAMPGGRLRRETRLGRKKTAGLVAVRDGKTVGLAWPAQGRFWTGCDLPETPEAGVRRLRALYSIGVSTGGHVAKQATWRVDLLSPEGGLRRSLWVSRESGLLLKSEDYRLDGTLARRERFTKLSLAAAVPDPSFRLEPPAGRQSAEAFVPGWVRWVPDGFMLVEPGPDRVRYSDGAASVVIERLSALPALSGARKVEIGSRGLSLLKDRSVLIRSGGRDYLLSGDLPEDELARMALSMEDGR